MFKVNRRTLFMSIFINTNKLKKLKKLFIYLENIYINKFKKKLFNEQIKQCNKHGYNIKNRINTTLIIILILLFKSIELKTYMNNNYYSGSMEQVYLYIYNNYSWLWFLLIRYLKINNDNVIKAF